MANNSQKKIVANNQQKIKISLAFIGLSILFFLIWRFLRGTMTTSSYICFIINALLQIIPFFYTYSISRPTYSINGEIEDYGSDLNQEGFISYIHDIIYFSSIVQFFASFTLFAMYLYIIMVCYICYLLYSLCGKFSNFGNQNEEEDPSNRRERRKNKTKVKVVRK